MTDLNKCCVCGKKTDKGLFCCVQCKIELEVEREIEEREIQTEM